MKKVFTKWANLVSLLHPMGMQIASAAASSAFKQFNCSCNGVNCVRTTDCILIWYSLLHIMEVCRLKAQTLQCRLFCLIKHAVCGLQLHTLYVCKQTALMLIAAVWTAETDRMHANENCNHYRGALNFFDANPMTRCPPSAKCVYAASKCECSACSNFCCFPPSSMYVEHMCAKISEAPSKNIKFEGILSFVGQNYGEYI